MDVFDITAAPVTLAISESTFSALRRDLPKKHHKVQDCLNKLEQLRTDHDALSQSDCWHTRHCEDWKEVSLCQLKSPRENLRRGMGKAEWKMSPPHFKMLRHLCYIYFYIIGMILGDNHV